jgi:hypothetical protein
MPESDDMLLADRKHIQLARSAYGCVRAFGRTEKFFTLLTGIYTSSRHAGIR